MNDYTKLTLAVLVAFIIVSIVAISPVAAQDDIDTSNLDIGDINAPDEADIEEEIQFESSAEIPDLPADWSAELEFNLYVDESQVGTQEISIEDGESTDVIINHQLQEDGDKEVYFEIVGELTREGALSEQSADIDQTTQTITIEVIDDGADDDDDGIIGDDDDGADDDDDGIIGDDDDGADDDDGIIDDGPELGSVSVEGATFVAPDTIQNDIDEVRDDLPAGLEHRNVPNAFVLASSDQIYVVLTSEEPEEGYASVEGQSVDLGAVGLSDITITGNQETVNIQPIVADDVEFTSPSEVNVQEVYENTEQYDRQYVEINANHRSIAVDYEETEFAATSGVLVEEPLEAEELFGSVGEQSQTALDDLDGDNIGNVLGDLSQARVVTTSYETEYWDNTEVTMQGIVAGPDTPAGEFIQVQQEDSILPTDSNTPILYKTDTDYEAESVGDISEIAANPGSYDGQTVQFETNLYMNTISSATVIESATGTQLPVDTILHGGVGWEQLPEDRDDVVGIIAASSIEQTTLSETRDGKYEVTGEVVSTDRIEGDLPGGYILIAYNLERTGSIDTASPADVIEEQSSSVSNVLEQQANPDADVSSSSTDTPAETTEEEEVTEEDDEVDTTEENETDTTESSQPETDEEDTGAGESDSIIEEVVDIISGLFGSTNPAIM